jgi:hypothetical protein
MKKPASGRLFSARHSGEKPESTYDFRTVN